MNGDGEAERTPDRNERSPADDAFYECARQTVLEQVSPGLIVELGATDSTFASAIEAAGYSYVGISDRPEALLSLHSLGRSGIQSDLSDLQRLSGLLDVLGPIGAFCILSALDRLAAPDRLLAFLAKYATAHNIPKLIIAAPNIGHHEIGLRLLAGHLPVELTPAGPAVRTHYFTGRSLSALVEQSGWQIVARRDLADEHLEPHAAPNLLLEPTQIGDFLRSVSATFNPDARISRFIWVLQPLPASIPAIESEIGSGPLLSILVRTQGDRNEHLVEALYSVFSQTCDDYEVVMCFHRPDDVTGDLKRALEQTISKLPDQLLDKLRVIESQETGRGAPLNALLEHARGRYLSILDDDDLLFEHHVATLKRGVAEHGSSVLFQTFAALRLIEPATPPGAPPADASTPSVVRHRYPYTVVAMSVPWDQPLDPVRQHHENMVPICNLAIPLELVRQTTLRFRTDIEVGEEWAFWMEALQLLRVVVLPEVTAAVNHWNNTSTNAMRRPEYAPFWRQVRDSRHAEAAHVPLLLDGPARQRLSVVGQQLEELGWLREVVRKHEARLASIYASRFWRTARTVWRARRSLQRARSRIVALLRANST